MNNRPVFSFRKAFRNHLHVMVNMTTFKIHLVPFALPGNRNVKFRRKGVNNRGPNPMKPPRNLITTIAELSTGVKNRKDRFEGRLTRLLLNINRNPPAIISHSNTIIRFDNNINFITKTC